MTSFRQLSFSGGEITPAVWGRVDQVKHATGLRLCKNFFVMRHGGVANRAGTYFVGEASDSSTLSRLIPFVFNLTQTYVLEFGHEYMRVIRSGVHEKDLTATISGATKADPCVITATAHGLSNGDEVYISGVKGMIELNVRNYKVASVTANTFEIQSMDGVDIDSTGYTTYTSAGTAERVYTITTPYQGTDLAEIYFAQSADIITITHPSYQPRELARTDHTVWTLTAISYGATVATPTGLASDAAGSTYNYVITAIDDNTGEESLPTAEVGSSTRTSTLTWDSQSGVSTFNVYVDQNGMQAWIGIAGTNSFTDDTYTEDPLDNPPVERLPFDAADDYPSVVAFYQQRAVYANTNNAPETVFGSKSTLRKNFMISTPMQADDAVTFTLAGTKVNSVRHLVSLGKLIVFTDSGEWVIDGDASGLLIPGSINPRQHTSNGANTLVPLVVEGSALYVQARGSVVRDLNYDYQADGYRGNELSIFSAHLFDGYTMVDWAYQQIPNSVVWIARSDGKVLGMTYVREHSMFGWHQHDFGGDVESVCVIPSGTEDALYLIVKRVIDGRTVRYIEFMKTRLITDIVDGVFMDSALSYDGRNTTAQTMTLSTAGGWTHEDDITITSSTAYFSAAEVGNAIWLTAVTGVDEDGEDVTDSIRITITAYTSTTVVTGRPNKTIDTAFQGVALTSWSRAVDVVTGLWHLEGETVSVFADGFVVASPNNASYTTQTVANGAITLDTPHAVIHVGLPIEAEIQTLDIDQPDFVLTDKAKHVSKLALQVQASRGIFAGPIGEELTEFKIRSAEDYDDPVGLQTGVVDMNTVAKWDKSGGVSIQQIDPLPLAVLSAIPSGYLIQKKKTKNT